MTAPWVLPLAGVVGSIGAVAGYRSRVPAGVLVGTLLGIGGTLTALDIEGPEFPRQVGSSLQILVGLMVGLRMSRSSFSTGMKLLLPASLVAVAMLSVAVGSAVIIARLTAVSLETALFAASPGGMTEMTSVAASIGADGAAVAAVHLARLLAALGAANLFMIWARRKASRAEISSEATTGTSQAIRNPNPKGFGIAVLAAVTGGTLGVAAGIPGGGLVGSLAGAASVRLTMGDMKAPIRSLQVVLQVLAGIVIGMGIDRLFFEKMGRLGVAAVIVIVGQLLLWVITSSLLTRILEGDRVTGLFSAGPGGMSEMIAVADQAGADTVVVSFIHLVRLSSIVVMVPTLLIPLLSHLPVVP